MTDVHVDVNDDDDDDVVDDDDDGDDGDGLYRYACTSLSLSPAPRTCMAGGEGIVLCFVMLDMMAGIRRRPGRIVSRRSGHRAVDACDVRRSVPSAW